MTNSLEDANDMIAKKLSKQSNRFYYTKFKSKSVPIVRLCPPVGIMEMTVGSPTLGGEAMIPKLIQREGLNIVLRAPDQSTMELPIQCTDELWDAVDSTAIYMSTNPMEVMFDTNGIAYDIKVKNYDFKRDNPEFNQFESVIPVGDDDPRAMKVLNKLHKDINGYKTLMGFVNKEDNYIPSGASDNSGNTMSNLVVLTSKDSKTLSVLISDPNLPEGDVELIRSGFESKMKKGKRSLDKLDVIGNPKAMIFDVRDGNTFYVKVL